MDREIHKIDKYLLRTGIILLAYALLATACAADSTMYEIIHEGADGTRESTYHWRIMGSEASMRSRFPGAVAIEEHPAGGRGFWVWMLVAAVVMTVAGAYLHRRENRAVLMWNFLDEGVEVSIGDLCASTSINRRDVPGILALINAQPGAHYVLDDRSDTIVDGRLRNRFVVLEHCGNCGAHVEAKIPLDLAVAPICQYCGANASSADVNRLKRDALVAIRAQKVPGEPSPFSLLVFILMLLAFWPGAVFYALWKAGVFASWRHRARNEAPV
jgi:hypothetical protein